MARRQGTEKRLVAGGAGCVSQPHSFTVTFFEKGVGVTCAAGPASRWFCAGELDGAAPHGRRGGAASYGEQGHVSIVRSLGVIICKWEWAAGSAPICQIRWLPPIGARRRGSVIVLVWRRDLEPT
jgi:hypothetical protein